MKFSTVHVLDATGDITISWTAEDPKSIENARKEIMALKEAGYSFFVTDGRPADEIAAAGAECRLLGRRIEAEEIIPAPVAAATTAVSGMGVVNEPKRMGRRPKSAPAQSEAIVTAVRPLRGG